MGPVRCLLKTPSTSAQGSWACLAHNLTAMDHGCAGGWKGPAVTKLHVRGMGGVVACKWLMVSSFRHHPMCRSSPLQEACCFARCRVGARKGALYINHHPTSQSAAAVQPTSCGTQRKKKQEHADGAACL